MQLIRQGNFGYLTDCQGNVDKLWVSTERYNKGEAGILQEIKYWFYMEAAEGHGEFPFELYLGIDVMDESRGYFFQKNTISSDQQGYFIISDMKKCSEYSRKQAKKKWQFWK